MVRVHYLHGNFQSPGLGAGDLEHFLLRVPVLLQPVQVTSGSSTDHLGGKPFIRLGGYQFGRLPADSRQLLRFFQLNQNVALDGEHKIVRCRMRHRIGGPPAHTDYAGHTWPASMGRFSINTSIASLGLALLSRLDKVCIRRLMNCTIS